MIAAKQTKHDTYVQTLIEQVRNDYDVVLTHIPLYSKKKRLVGEIDVVAIKGEQCDVYEVKCSHRIVKAKRQLTKIKQLLPHYNIRYAFFYCGMSNQITSI